MEQGRALIGELPEVVRYRGYLGCWAFTDDRANQAVRLLAGADLPEAWNALGGLCTRVAQYELENIDTGCSIVTSSGETHGFEYLAFFGVRAYLFAGDEKQAVDTLHTFSRYPAVAKTLESGFSSAGEEAQAKWDGFNLPNLDTYERFKERVTELVANPEEARQGRFQPETEPRPWTTRMKEFLSP